MKIKSITIKRFRSIMNLTLNIDELSYLITICGANNSGKTNVLRALEFDLTGIKALSGKLNKEPIKEERINTLLNKIAFFYLPAINVNFPELVNDLIEEIYDLEYEKARFTGLKGEL